MRYQIGEWTVDEAANLLTRDNEKVRVEKRVMAVLSQLAKAKGNVVSKHELIETVWNGASVSDHSVANAISDLRRALGDDRRNSRYIETIPKSGYRLIAEQSKGPPNAEASIKPINPLPVRIAALLGIGGLIALALVFWLSSSPPQLKRLYLANIENATDDPALTLAGDVGAEMMTVALAGGEYRLVRGRAGGFDTNAVGPGIGGNKHDRLLKGRIVLDGQAPLLTLQLIDLSDGASIWAGAYDFNTSRYALLADEIVTDLMAPLGLSEVSPRIPRADADTLEAYWRARYLWSLREHSAIREALRILTELTYDSPNFAPAHAALADIYAHKSAEELAVERGETFSIAEHHLNRALSLDPALNDALVTKAFLNFYRDRDNAAAMAAVQRAIGEEPHNPVAWQTRAMVESAAGQYSDSLQSIARARELDPLSASMMWDQVWFLYISRDYDEALDMAARARRMSAPNDAYEALIHQQRGDLAAAFPHWRARAILRGLSPEKADNIEHIASTAGVPAALGALANEAVEDPNYYEHPVPLAALFIAAGEDGRAVKVLEEAPLMEKSWWWRWFDLIPAFDSVRDAVSLESRRR